MLPWLLLACGTDDPEPVLATTPTRPGGVDADGDGVDSLSSGGRDCDDTDESVFPGADEVCNRVDDDCDGEVDDGVGESAWLDEDGDGYGAPGTEEIGCDLDGAPRGGDCDDLDEAIHPDADERCNGIDDDCLEATVEVAELGSRGFFDLQDAVDAAMDDDVIELCDGELPVAGVVVDKRVTITSKSGDPAVTALVGDDQSSVLIVTGDLTLRGVTVRNGNGSVVAAINNARVGGGIQSIGETSALTVEDCVIEDNRAEYGGGIYARNLTLVDSLVRGNDAEGFTAFGGGVYVYELGSAVVEGSRFTQNTALYGAGARFFGPATVTDTEFVANTATIGGGGIYTSSDLTLTGVTISTNEAGSGGGVYASAGNVTADPTTLVTGNLADVGGGAYLTGFSEQTWFGGRIEANNADVGGGMIADRRGADVQGVDGYVLITGVEVIDNRAMVQLTSTGGGVYLVGSPVGLTDSLLEGNESMFGGGSSVNETSSVDTVITRVTYRDNYGQTVGGGSDMYRGRATFTDCVFESNRSANGGAIMVDTSSRLTTEGTTWGDDPVENDPEDVWVGDFFNDPTNALTYDYDGVVNVFCQLANPGCNVLP